MYVDDQFCQLLRVHGTLGLSQCLSWQREFHTVCTAQDTSHTPSLCACKITVEFYNNIIISRGMSKCLQQVGRRGATVHSIYTPLVCVHTLSRDSPAVQQSYNSHSQRWGTEVLYRSTGPHAVPPSSDCQSKDTLRPHVDSRLSGHWSPVLQPCLDIPAPANHRFSSMYMLYYAVVYMLYHAVVIT